MAYPFNAGTRHPCEIEDCDADFARLADKQRHVREHHGDLLHCPEPGCSWPGAKRRSRLDLHRQKEHGNIQKVALIVPVGFGSTSPEQSSYILAQAAQPESSSTAATYGAFNDSSSYPRTTGGPADPLFSVTQDNPILLPGSQYETPQTFANIQPQGPRAYDTSFSSYQHHPVVPGEASVAMHPPLTFPYAGSQFEDGIGDGNASGSDQQGPDRRGS